MNYEWDENDFDYTEPHEGLSCSGPRLGIGTGVSLFKNADDSDFVPPAGGVFDATFDMTFG